MNARGWGGASGGGGCRGWAGGGRGGWGSGGYWQIFGVVDIRLWV